MNNKIDIFNELQAISPLMAGMEKVNVFTVPPGYFEGISDHIAMLVKEDDHGSLAGLTGLNTFEVPSGYFDTLSANILNKVKAQQNETASDELKGLSTRLYSIQNENVFEVPRGYFEGLSGKILEKIQTPKVVVMHRRSSTFIKYAVAAAFTGVMAFGVYKFIEPKAGNQGEPSYVTAGLQIQNKNVDEELAKVSDDDIIKYLQANGENIDAQTLASNTLNENELPNQADYFSDDKTLDKYFDNIDINDLKN